MARYQDIKQLPRAHYEVDVEWRYLEKFISNAIENDGLNLEPDFQRAHVWTREQQVAYVEYVMQGGEVGKNLTFNAPGWGSFLELGSYEIVDGKQRLEAVRAFLRDEFPAFGSLRSEYTDPMRLHLGFKWRICGLQTRAEILQLYLNINAGGTPHTQDELDRVRTMLAQENIIKNEHSYH
jgi:Protein of unknown function DUF262